MGESCITTVKKLEPNLCKNITTVPEINLEKQINQPKQTVGCRNEMHEKINAHRKEKENISG